MKIKIAVFFLLNVISITAYSAADDKESQDQKDRIEIENKQANLTHTADFVSKKRGPKNTLLTAPIKKDDAVTDKQDNKQKQ